MAVTEITARQRVLAAVAQLSIANIGAGNEVTVALPPGAHITQLLVITSTAFDGTTNTLTISDGTNTLVSAEDVKTTGSETVDLSVTMRYPNGGTLTISMAQTGTATVGAVTVIVSYIDVERQDERYGV